MKLRKASDLLAVNDVEYGYITVPVQDGELEVRVRGLTAREQVELDQGQAQEDITPHQGFDSMINVILLGTVDEDGKRLFTDEATWREWLESRTEGTLMPWVSKIWQLTTGEEPARPGKLESGDVSALPGRSHTG